MFLTDLLFEFLQAYAFARINFSKGLSKLLNSLVPLKFINHFLIRCGILNDQFRLSIDSEDDWVTSLPHLVQKGRRVSFEVR
jgi:hypothetical protein